MNSSTHVGALRQGVDPFGERQPLQRLRVRVLGAIFEFTANDSRLLELVRYAYAGLPQHRLSGPSPRFRVALRLADSAATRGKVAKRVRSQTPATMKLHSGAGFLCGSIDADSFVIASPSNGTAIVSVSRAMLAFPYHVRYELIEFAVYILAARGQCLLPLHAACISQRGRAVLLIGESGAGKSTLALHCMRSGMEFVAEDSALIQADTLKATGVGTFLHLRVGSDHFLPVKPRWIAAAPVIRRRSGVQKFEIDLRSTTFRLAKRTPRIVSVVFLTTDAPPRGRESVTDLLVPLTHKESVARLKATQAYAVTQPGWKQFVEGISTLKCHVLYRSKHPAEQVVAIESLF